MTAAESKKTIQDHQRLMSNLKLIQKNFTVAELSALLGVSINAQKASLTTFIQ